MTMIDDQRLRIVAAAREWLGTPYLHQASAKGAGCDCLGLVRGVWRAIEGNEPEPVRPYSSAWAVRAQREELLDMAGQHFCVAGGEDIQPADLLVFRMRRKAAAKHLGIATGTSSFIHAYDGNQTVETSLDEFWRGCLAGRFRFPSVSRLEAN